MYHVPVASGALTLVAAEEQQRDGLRHAWSVKVPCGDGYRLPMIDGSWPGLKWEPPMPLPDSSTPRNPRSWLIWSRELPSRQFLQRPNASWTRV